MSDNLLHQIQNEAVDSDTCIASILRKCRMLAQRIDSSELKNWTTAELNGYSLEADLPDYRILRTPAIRGSYFGFYGAQINNYPIPHSAFPSEYRESLIPVKFRQGLGELSALSDGGQGVTIAIAPDFYPWIKDSSLREDFSLASATKFIPASFIDGILDIVRNRVLNFTLELEEFASSAGNPLTSLKEQNPQEVKQTFNTHIMGSVSNLNQGGNSVSQTVIVQKGDLEGTIRQLEEAGISADDIELFREVLISERPSEDRLFGPKVSALLGRVIQKASMGLLSISAGAASGILTEILNNYYFGP